MGPGTHAEICIAIAYEIDDARRIALQYDDLHLRVTSREPLYDIREHISRVSVRCRDDQTAVLLRSEILADRLYGPHVVQYATRGFEYRLSSWCESDDAISLTQNNVDT